MASPLGQKLAQRKAPPEPPAKKEKTEAQKASSARKKERYRAKRPWLHPKFRLPDGAHFSARYEASDESWNCGLTIGFGTSQAETFFAHHSSLHFCFKMLGQQWFAKHPECIPGAVIPDDASSDSTLTS